MPGRCARLLGGGFGCWWHRQRWARAEAPLSRELLRGVRSRPRRPQHRGRDPPSRINAVSPKSRRPAALSRPPVSNTMKAGERKNPLFLPSYASASRCGSPNEASALRSSLASLLRRLLRSLASRLTRGRLASSRLASRRLASGRLASSRLASGLLLGGGGRLASRGLLDFPFHNFLSHGTSLFLSVYLSHRSSNQFRTKKMMCKFEDFVDSKIQITRYEPSHSNERVARNPHFSRLSNAMARCLQILHPLPTRPIEHCVSQHRDQKVHRANTRAMRYAASTTRR